MTLKPGLGVTQGHWKWYHSTDWVWFPISVLYPRTDSDSALIRRSTAGRPTDTYRTGSTRFLCRSPIRLELFTCWHSTVRERSLI